jgi:vacuolar-type H+-ATPase subunit F/Vma7
MNARSVRVVARPELAAGFALAGLSTVEATTPEEGAARIADLASREDVGLILTEEDFLDAVPESLRRELWRRPVPILVPFQRPAWAERVEVPEAYIVAILQRAIGYRVKLR